MGEGIAGVGVIEVVIEVVVEVMGSVNRLE